MGVRFIIGRAGSGKTRRIFEETVRLAGEDPLGSPVYWLLPKQATFQMERQFAVESGLPGICRVLVLSFDQFGEMIRQQCGGIAIPQIDAYGRQMILGHLLRTHEKELRFFKAVARQPGLVIQLDDAFGEFERLGRSAQELGATVGNTPDPFDPYSAKLHDLRLLYAAYEKYLGKETIDPHRRLTQILGCIADWPEMKTARVYVDGFFDFSASERQTLASLAAGGADVTITALLDPSDPTIANPSQRPGEMNLFHRTANAYRLLHAAFVDAGVTIETAVRLDHAAMGFTEPLRHIEQSFFGPRTVKPSENIDGLCLIEAPDRRSEVDAVARHVKQLLADGMRLRDIAVLARELGPYRELLATSFAEHGLPCFIDRRTAASHHPLIRFTRLLPLLVDNHWPNEAIIGMCKTGLLGIPELQCDELERYVQDHRIDGAAWIRPEPWAFRVATIHGEQPDLPGRMDALRRTIVERLQPWSKTISQHGSVRAIVAAMADLFTACGITTTLEGWIAAANDRPEEAVEPERVWTELSDLLRQMHDLLGDESVEPLEFAGILEAGLERFDLGVTPPMVDQVLIGTIDRTRTPALKAVVLIGFNDGSFPQRPGFNPLLSDADRDTLGVGGDSTRKILDERLLAYYGLTRATNHLCVTRPTADTNGKKLPPSPYWLRLLELFPTLQPIKVQPHDGSTIGTPQQLTTRLMRWVDGLEGETIDPAAPFASLYQWLFSRPADDSVGKVRDQAWPALSYQNRATLNEANKAALFKSPLTTNVRELESFAACPFQHFARYGLHLRSMPQSSVSGGDLSRLYEEVLQRVIARMIEKNRSWTGPSRHTRAAVHEETSKIGRTLRDEILISSARNRFLLTHAQTELELAIATQEQVAAISEFHPQRIGVSFGSDSDDHLPAFPIETAGGHHAELSGSIDRIDLAPSANGVAASIVEYQLGGGSLPLDRVYHGLSLQLLTYLLVLQASGESLEGKPLTSAAAFYVKMLRKIESVDHPDEAPAPGTPDFLLKEKMRGVVDAEFINRLDPTLEKGMSSSVIAATMTKKGELGSADRSDVALPHEFAGLLRLVQRRLAEWVDRLLAGNIAVKPYRIGNESPCARCSYRSVCRFDPTTDRYNHLNSMKRSEVLAAAAGETDRE